RVGDRLRMAADGLPVAGDEDRRVRSDDQEPVHPRQRRDRIDGIAAYLRLSAQEEPAGNRHAVNYRKRVGVERPAVPGDVPGPQAISEDVPHAAPEPLIERNELPEINPGSDGVDVASERPSVCLGAGYQPQSA